MVEDDGLFSVRAITVTVQNQSVIHNASDLGRTAPFGAEMDVRPSCSELDPVGPCKPPEMGTSQPPEGPCTPPGWPLGIRSMS